jgi:thioredoxin reductase
MEKQLPVAVIGAGPVGLAAASHLLARGETPIVFEAGDGVGHTVKQWQHVKVFTPWEYVTDPVAVSMLEASGWKHPAKCAIPTGGELVAQYLEPLASLSAMRPHLRFGSRVTAVGRKGFDKVKTAGRAEQPFVLRVKEADGREHLYEAKAVIDASGTWLSPNPVGAGGLPAAGETEAADWIHYGIPDVLGTARARYAGKTVMVVGSGHSAINALIDLVKLSGSAPATRVIWALRRENIESAFGGGAADALPERAELGAQAREIVETGRVRVVAPMRIETIERRADGGLLVIGVGKAGGERRVEADEIIGATGFRPDFSFLREIRLTVDPWLESAGEIGPLIDPNLHSCGTVRPHGYNELQHPEKDFYIVGMKSYGRAPTFLTLTGYEQVRSIVAALTGDLDAAGKVSLVLPETGVCSTPLPTRLNVEDLAAVETASCCGPKEMARIPELASAGSPSSGCCSTS